MSRGFGVRNKWLPMVVATISFMLALMLSTAAQAQGPALTTISDTVYRADGTPASGAVLISWPSFQTAEGDAVAAGNLAVTLGAGGSFVAQLVPNVGASPAGTYYVSVFQLDDGTVRTEYWAIPATSPTTIAAVLTTPGTGLGNLAVTEGYVNAAVANRAIDSTVVHLAGAETITGTKQFTVPPSFPAPSAANDAANKSYVDAAVSTVGSGSYVSKAGDTMTGPLTLPADPVAPNQAADRHYVDTGLGAKADVVNGTVPTAELAAGVASSATCLNGNSTWGSCGSGAPAGITYATTALNWTQTISSSLTGGVRATVTLTPCPVGIDTTSGAGYEVLISGGGNSEAVSVLTAAGGCTPGAPSGSITFTPFNSYAAGYTIGSASSGIQETLNAACGVSATPGQNNQCNVAIPANGPNSTVNTYNVSGTIYLHSNQSVLNGYGTSLNCIGRAACLQVGDLRNSNDSTDNTVAGLSFRSPINLAGNPAFAGVPITQTQRSSQVVTITTAAPHGFRIGDMVVILFTDAPAYWGDAMVTAVPSTTTFQYAHAGGDIAAQTTPGVVALAYEAVLDNALNTHFTDISYDKAGEYGRFNNFFDFWDDENATIEHFNNQAIPLNNGVNWTGSFVFSGGNQASATASVITLRDSTITANYSNGVTDYNSNGLYIENTVIQASGPWQVYSANTTGNYQGAFLKNIYTEGTVHQNYFLNISGTATGVFQLYEQIVQATTGATAYVEPNLGGSVPSGTSPLYFDALVGTPDATHTWTGQTSGATYAPTSLPTARSPFHGTGIAGLIAGNSSTAASFQIRGTGVGGAFQTGGTGGTSLAYYVVANDWGGASCGLGSHSQTSPMPVMYWGSTGSDNPLILWPRIANGADSICYDLIRMATPINTTTPFPYAGGCTGGAGGACGSVVTGLTQATACNGGLVCSYQDTASTSTSSYSINNAYYSGPINFWPGSLVTENKTITVDNEESNLVGIGMQGNAIQVAAQCSGYGSASPGGYTVCEMGGAITNSVPNQPAMILGDGPAAGTTWGGVKGRQVFETTPYQALNPRHIITLIDSQPGLTQATPKFRPPWSASDCYIGSDVAAGTAFNLGQISFGCPVAITNYIGQVGDGVHANWLERLTSSLKEFNVPAKFDQNVSIAGLANGCLNIASGVIASTGSPCGSGGGGGSVSSVFGRSGAVVAASGDYTVSQVTGAAADAAVVHNTGAETISGVKTFTNNVAVIGNLLLPASSGYTPAVGGVGLDTAAGLPVVNIGGTTQQVALTSSNISGQAGTALALASTPTQCSGAFATGIAANGNANCTTPNVIQLSETTPPSGIPNWGVFWFDSATHTPRIIENNGLPIQLGFTNLFNSDPGGDPADNLEEINVSDPLNPANFRVYSSYTNNTTWTRMSLGSEALSGTNYNVLRSEDATSGNALSLGIHIGSGIKWFFSSDGTFKPNPDNSYDIGTDTGQAMRSVFAKTSFNMYSSGRQDFEFANDTTSGTTVNQLAVYNSGVTGVQTGATSSTDGVLGIISSGAGTSGKAVVTWAGLATCNFDAVSPVAGDYVVASSTQAGKCHDSGSTTRPTGVQVIGRIEPLGVRVSLDPPTGSGGGGAVSSVFGRTGVVAASSGDYSVGQITGAAADSAVVHLAGTETITGSKTFSSDVTLNGNLNVAGNINQTSTGPTQWSGKQWSATTVTVPSGMDFSLGLGSDNSFKCQLASGASCTPAGAVSSVFGRTGAVAASSGDYSVGQVTGAAPLASPTFTGTPAGPTPSAGDNSTKLATTAFVLSALPANSTAIPWLTFSHGGSNINFSTAANKAIFTGVILDFAKTTSQVSYNVSTIDNTSNTYDLGIYSGSAGGTCTQVAHVGSTAGTSFASSTGWKTSSWTGGSVTLQPGRYYLAYTTSCTSSCATLMGDTGGFTFAGNSGGANSNVSVSSGGTLPATATCPADSYATTSAPNWAIN